MIFPRFRKSRRSNNPKPFTARRRFTHERLEPREMLTINPTGADYLVNDVVAGFQGVTQNASSVAVSHTSGMLVAYSGRGIGSQQNIYLGRYDFEGTVQDIVSANTSTRGLRSDAVVAANDAGDTVLAWHGQGVGDKYGIYMQRYDATGTAVGEETLVNQTLGGSQHDPAIAMASDGSYVITWTGVSAADPVGIFARRFNADGTAASDETRINTTTTKEQTEPAIAMSRNGDYVIVWTSRDQDGDSFGVFGQRFDSDGVAQGDEFQLNTTTSSAQNEASVAMQDDGTFMAVWGSLGQDGDSWSIVGQLFDSSGTTVGGEIAVNTTTADNQRHPQIAGARGKYLVTWQSGVLDGSGWEVMSQDYDSTGAPIGTETVVNTDLFGVNSGNQEFPAVALNAAGRAAIVWSGKGTADRQGVYAQNFLDDDAVDANSQPALQDIPTQIVDDGEEFILVVTATDADDADTLRFELDMTVSPEGATITRSETDPRAATIRWTPTFTNNTEIGIANFRVTVTDNGIGQLSDTKDFRLEVGRLAIDLNGPDESGFDATAQFERGLGPVSITDDNLFIRDAQDDQLARVTVVLADTPDGSSESLDVDVLDTNITATYTPSLKRLFLTSSGDPETAENYERVLRTLTYNNTAANPTGTRSVQVRLNETNGGLSNLATITIDIVSADDFVGLANAIVDANAQFFGAAWSDATAQQRALFEDGGQLLPFTDVTDANRTLNNDVATEFNVTLDAVDNPVWIFDDGTAEGRRVVGVLTPAELAAELEIEIPLSGDPTFVEVPDQTLLIGSPSHISLDGYDPTGGPLTYTVSTNMPDLVEAEILSGNRSARVSVEGYGDMVFELFEQRAERATERFIQLASDDLFNDGEANNDFFYDDVIFHRVINDFVIQGGDPDGNGTGGTGTDYDDQFHVDIQHNRTGLLSSAKSLEDTNDSQFFITEHTDEDAATLLRRLDFHHSIFGVLTEGEGVRAAISDTSTNTDDLPANPATAEEFDITMSNVEIFDDTENAVLFLKANSAATVGEVVEVTVTVTDAQGNSFDQTFNVTLAADTFNGTPFLDDIDSPVTIDADTTAVIQLAAMDAEDDDVEYGARLPFEIVNGQLVVINQPDFDFTVDADTGEVTVTPTAGFTGTLLLEVQVGAVGIGGLESVGDSFVDRQVITIIVE